MKINFSTRNWYWILITLVFASYILFQARFLILGPQVSIDSPRDGEAVSSPLLTISGRGSNIAWISLNDRQIFTDEKGLWSEKLIVAQGLSIMTVRVVDRFGREQVKSVRVLLPAQAGLN